MTALTLKLKTSHGVDVTLRSGYAMGWADFAKMDWVRMVDGLPELVTATLALEWQHGLQSPICKIDLGTSEPWDDFPRTQEAWNEDNATRFYEWAHGFRQAVEEALRRALSAALVPYANLHWHEVEAAKVFARLDNRVMRGWTAPFNDGEGSDPTQGELLLARHVVNVLLPAVCSARDRVAAAQYEEMGGKLETEDAPGSERTPGIRSLAPDRVLPCWCASPDAGGCPRHGATQ
jgi:hypothetical protein